MYNKLEGKFSNFLETFMNKTGAICQKLEK